MATDKLIDGNRITDTDPLPVSGTVALDAAALAALENITVTLPVGQTTAAQSTPVVLADGLTSVNVIIADGASLSAEGDLGVGNHLVGVIFPSGWDTNVMTFAASLTTGGTFVPVYSASGAEVVTGSLVASTWVALDPADFAGMRFIKVRSGTNAAAVNQSGAVTLTLVARVV